MKKFIILLSIIALVSCDLLSDKDIKAITNAEGQAKESIKAYTNNEIERAKKEIGKIITSEISKADTTLTKRFQQIESSLNTKAEDTKKELSSKISGIENRITNAFVFSLSGIIIGFIGIILAVAAYKKRPRTDVNKVIEIIDDRIKNNVGIQKYIRLYANSASGNHSQTIYQQQIDVGREIDSYIKSERFRDIIMQSVNANVALVPNSKDNIRNDGSNAIIAKPVYQIFAKESNTMILSNIQETYQKGKSIFKLILLDSNAATAEISVCVEQEEVKQRILKFDSQYLEPICTVTRSSNEPTEVIIKSTGIAERVGDEWKVTKPIIIEIK